MTFMNGVLRGLFQVILLSCMGALAIASSPSTGSAQRIAQVVCDQMLQANPTYTQTSYKTEFVKVFRNRIPFGQLMAVFSQLQSQVGSCGSFQTTVVSANRFVFKLKTSQNFIVKLIVVIDPASTQIEGLQIGSITDPSVLISDWTALKSNLRNLDRQGEMSATLMTPGHKIFLTDNSREPLAIGSTFKLYILGALQRAVASGHLSWNQTLSIHENWKSLPSGVMQTFPDGAKYSLLYFATKMISISDNTAADHLLHFLGRRNVEAMFPVMGNSHYRLDRPVLSTLDMFKLKWGAVPASITESYIHGDEVTRVSILKKLAKIPRSAIPLNSVDLSRPKDIDSLEWFGSTEDNCNAMFWLASRNDANVRQVLATNVPFVKLDPASHWAYVGYKGGSETGVVSMTYLLESKSGNRACLSMTWNDQIHDVSDYKFFDIVRKTLKLAARLIP